MAPIVVSYSELDTYRQCPLKHHLAYRERWTRPLEEGDRRSIGTLWHTVMEEHYRIIAAAQQQDTRPDPLTILRTATATIKPLLVNTATGEQSDEQALVMWMYEGYIQQYGIDPQWEILGIEKRIEEALPTASGRRSRFRIKARIDLIVRDVATGKIWVVDHKSGADLPTQQNLEIDDQFGLYTWLMRRSGVPVVGAIHSAARTRRNQADFPGYVGKSKPQNLDQRFGRVYLNRSDEELDALAHDAFNAAQNAYPPKSKTLPLYSSPDPRMCGWKCDFKETHLAMRTGIDPQDALVDFGFVQDFTRH